MCEKFCLNIQFQRIFKLFRCKIMKSYGVEPTLNYNPSYKEMYFNFFLSFFSGKILRFYGLIMFYHDRIEVVYIVAARSLYYSLEQLSNPEKEQFLPKILAIPGLSLNLNTTNPQKKLARLLCRAPLIEKRQVVVGHDIINIAINSHRTSNNRACTAKELPEILKKLTKISAMVFCQRNATPDSRNQLISSGILLTAITRCLISKRNRGMEHQECTGKHQKYQARHQDSVRTP